MVGQVKSRWGQDIGPAQLNANDPPAGDLRLKRVDDGLDFGQFGHGTLAVWERLI
jgi:hypothetical protein